MLRVKALTSREKMLALVAGILLVVLVIAGYLTSKDSGASVLSASPVASVEEQQE